MNKINIIHIKGNKPKISNDIFVTMSKSFEILLTEVPLEKIENIINEDKIHVVLFDDINYEDISLDLTNTLKEKFAHIHLVMVTTREDELKQMRILHRRIDNIWEYSYSDEYIRTVFRALLTRMSKRYIINKQIQIGDVVIDRVLREVKFKDHFIDLTGKEYKIFHELVVFRDKFISKAELFKKVWGDFEDTTRSLDQYLHRIKKKIEHLGLKIHSDKDMGLMLIINK